MSKKILIIIAILPLLYFAVLTAFGLRENVVTIVEPIDFTHKDLQLYVHNAMYTLDHKEDGAKVTWRNPYDGVNGYFIPLSTSIQKGVLCRKVIVYANSPAQHKEKRGTFTFCKIDRIWRVID